METQTRPLRTNLFDKHPEYPLVVAGPCSAETEEQVLATAHQLAQIPAVRLFRAGIWKPRTRPDNFEGVGVPALRWLKRVKAETGLPVTCEVATAHHAYEALKHGVDVLWIGARTTVNPFSVQEIAEALRGVDVPVMVKNPVNPDLALWLGALERLDRVGVAQLAGIHRGFSFFDNKPYRNRPMWHLAIEFKRQLPQMPLLCDPSHIGGSRQMLGDLSQKAIDLAMDGLMIETHPTPDAAWSDAAQQITPAALGELIARLHLRSEQPDAARNGHELAELRQQIDHLDDELMEVLSRRAQLSGQIGAYKKAKGMTILQVKRWDDVLCRRLDQGVRTGLDAEFVKSIFQAIHRCSIDIQTRVMNE